MGALVILILLFLLTAAPAPAEPGTRTIDTDPGYRAILQAHSGQRGHNGWGNRGTSRYDRHRGEHYGNHRRHRSDHVFSHDRHRSRLHFGHDSRYRYRRDFPSSSFGTLICLRDGWTRVCFLDNSWRDSWHD